MDQISQLNIQSNFNDEVIWDSKKPLFEIYFKKEIIDNRYRLSYFNVPDLDFDKALIYLKI